MIKNVYWCSCKVSSSHWNFLDRFSKNIQISNLMNIRPVEADLFQADRWSDMTKLIVTFHNFSNMPKND